MAELTKISSPLIPKENVGNKYKPTTDQAFELTDPSKVHKPAEDGKIMDRSPDNQALRESLGRASIAGLLKDTNDMTGVILRLVLLVETGVSAAEVMNSSEVKRLLQSMYVRPDELLASLTEQEGASVLFKGEAFDVLRDILVRFQDNPRIRDAVAALLKAFEHNVNAESSIRSILVNCENILAYMFSKDRQQFESYLDGLAETLLPQEGEAAVPEGEASSRVREGTGEERPAQDADRGVQQPGDRDPAVPGDRQAQGTNENQAAREAQAGQVPPEQADSPRRGEVGRDAQQPALSQKEMAQILKGNLLPLLGEIVVKYNQNERIRDHVMVVVHNTVRVDQGTPEALREAIGRLARELRQVANLPDDFTRNLAEAVMESGRAAKQNGNAVMEKLMDVISETLRSGQSSPAMIRQAETLLMSLLQNQGSMMDLLHFVLPIQTPDDQMIAELYVDPDSGQDGKGGGKQSRKLFLSFESQVHGSFELSFLQTEKYVDFAMWCPGSLVNGLGGMKRHFSDIMQSYGYTMSSFSIEEFKRPQSVAEVFPDLLHRRVGIDVRV